MKGKVGRDQLANKKKRGKGAGNEKGREGAERRRRKVRKKAVIKTKVR